MPPLKSRPAPSDSTGLRDARHEELCRQVLRQFRVVFNSVRSHFRELEKSTGLGGAQVWALSHIRENPGQGVNQLAAALDIHQSTASNLVRSLVEKNLIKTEQSKEDRRAVRLLVRPAGRALLRRVPGPATGALPLALQALDAAALKRLRRDLGLLVETLAPDQDGAQTLLADM